MIDITPYLPDEIKGKDEWEQIAWYIVRGGVYDRDLDQMYTETEIIQAWADMELLMEFRKDHCEDKLSVVIDNTEMAIFRYQQYFKKKMGTHHWLGWRHGYLNPIKTDVELEKKTKRRKSFGKYSEYQF